MVTCPVHMDSAPQGRGWLGLLTRSSLSDVNTPGTLSRDGRGNCSHTRVQGEPREDVCSLEGSRRLSREFPSTIRGFPPCFKQLQSQMRPSLSFPFDLQDKFDDKLYGNTNRTHFSP